MPGATTAVILGGGIGRRFGVLTSRESPKALLPVANAPLISYSVEWVAAAGLPRAIIVVAGEAAAAAVSRWAAEDYKGGLKLDVVGESPRLSPRCASLRSLGRAPRAQPWRRRQAPPQRCALCWSCSAAVKWQC